MALSQTVIKHLGDWRWRLNNLYTITDKRGKKVRFKPNPVQQHLYDNLHDRSIILKARQRGITTATCILFLDHCVFRDDVRAAVIAHKLDDAKVIFRDKVRNVYLDLPDAIRNRVTLTNDAADQLTFSNGSSIRVSTSTRSGTVQFLHISEYGKICAQFPEKGREIRTGAFPSAEQGHIIIESTAEGQEGDFFQKCQDAEAAGDRELSRLDYKFFFFPWWDADEYELKQSIVAESPEDTTYFERLELELGKPISQPKRNWWLAQERDLGGDMKREYPATPQEAFEQALEGSYFADQIASAEKHARIGSFPVDPGLPVNTAWDLGRSDDNVIWLFQDHNDLTVFVGCYANSGEWIGHYIDWLENWRKERDVQFGRHYLPHDGDVKNIWLPGGTLEVMQNLHFRPDIVKRSLNKIEVINTARRKFGKCAWDRNACKEGLAQLKRYRKDWDEKFGVFKDRPRHDTASHYADAYLTFTESGHIPLPPLIPKKRERYKSQPAEGGGSWMAA
jgi:hypothetical protein